MEDILRSLGFLCLGSRMKRIGEQLQADTQRVLDRLDMRIQSSQYPLLAALDRLGPLPVGELAQALGVAQPGVTRIVALLADLGLVEVNPSEDDQRRRIVSLSRNGRWLVDKAKRDIWPSIENAVADLCADLSGPLLGQLAAIEDRLAATPLHRPRRKREGCRVMTHVLDRPVWSALATRQRTFAEGDDRARRYRPAIIPFAATATDDPESLHALGRLVAAGETVILAQAESIVLPPALVATMTADAVQMTAEQVLQTVADPRIEQLMRQDATEMLALASLTKPGPFTLEALSLGEFWGVKIDGRLAAMAGERMKQPGYSELSGVCSHPDYRGGGLARLLSLFVANRIIARGEVPYLHAFANNTAAIRLYESIGFRLRSAMNIAVVQRAG